MSKTKLFADSFRDFTGSDYPNLTGDKPVVKKKMIVLESCGNCWYVGIDINTRIGYCQRLDYKNVNLDTIDPDCTLQDYDRGDL